jgi:hypothetical protein
MRILKSGKAPCVCMLAAIMVLLVGSPAWANKLPPGGSGSPDVLTIGVGATLLATTGAKTWSYTTTAGTTSGEYESLVYSDPTNVYCAGCLDFLFLVFNNASSADNLDRVTDSAFGAFSTDIGYLGPPSSCSLGPNVNPTTVDRSNDGGGVGNVAGFNFSGGSLKKGDCTSVLVVETNTKLFTNGNLSIIDSGTATVASFQPTAIPEPASMALMGTFLLGAYGVLRRKLKEE